MSYSVERSSQPNVKYDAFFECETRELAFIMFECYRNGARLIQLSGYDMPFIVRIYQHEPASVNEYGRTERGRSRLLQQDIIE